MNRLARLRGYAKDSAGQKEALERCQQFELRVQKRSEQESELLALCKQNAQRLEEESRAKAQQAKADEEAKAKAAVATAAAE